MNSIAKHLLRPGRVRQVPPSFSWLDHRLIRDGHLLRLQAPEILLYFFLVLVGDHRGLSYYSPRSISRYLKVSREEIASARERLSDRGLIAYKAPLYQVLSLPEKAEIPPATRMASRGGEAKSVGDILREVLEGFPDGQE